MAERERDGNEKREKNSPPRKNGLKNFGKKKKKTGGLVGPAAFGAARSATGGYGAACAMLSVFAAVAAVLYAVVLPFVAPDNEGRDACGGGGKKKSDVVVKVGGGNSSSSSKSPAAAS